MTGDQVPTLAIVVLVLATVATAVGLAVATVVVVDRLRATADGLVAVRDEVVPAAEQLRRDVERTGRRIEALGDVELRGHDHRRASTDE